MAILLNVLYILGFVGISFSAVVGLGILIEGPPWINRDYKDRYLIGGFSFIIGLISILIGRS